MIQELRAILKLFEGRGMLDEAEVIPFNVDDILDSDIIRINNLLFKGEVLQGITNKLLDQTIIYLQDLVNLNKIKDISELAHYLKKRRVRMSNFIRSLVKKRNDE